jgi:ribulose-5-phosphate 4-epimerase/fuculose-1-phosphate aldolase
MDVLTEPLRTLVVANRILAREGVVDAYGHVSIRHPGRPDRFFLSRSRSAELVTVDDLLEFDLTGEAVDTRGYAVYLERFIHAALYEARPDVLAIVHSHAEEVIPFSVTGTPLRAMCHLGARMGSDVRLWDISERFGDTNLLVSNLEQARDMARALGPHRVVLMRGHGCTVAAESLHTAVIAAIYTRLNARLQTQAMLMGPVKYLSPGELDRAILLGAAGTVGGERIWEYFRHRAGCDDI